MTSEGPSSAVGKPGLAAKVDNLCREIQELVTRAVESPGFELTRKCSLASGDKKSQADFAKTIQGLANAFPPSERVYVIGADQQERKFSPLDNTQEFDSANVRQILEKYLEPLPSFEVFVMHTDNAIEFAAVVVAADQPRPIVARIQAGDDKTQFLQKGDIWIKKNTGLTRANRDDLERIYETRIAAEAERRAEGRFADMRNGLEATFRLQFSPEHRMPSKDLVFGPGEEYKAYVELLLANQDGLRFHMLLTSIRDLLIEGWYSVAAFDSRTSFSSESDAALSKHLQSTFLPALRRLVFAGLLLIKFNMYQEWFKGAADLLIEVFAVCSRLPGVLPRSPGVPEEWVTRETIALEIVLSGRLLAAYVIRMERYEHLPELLRRVVIPVASSASRTREPFLFWPLRINVPEHDRVAYLWRHAVNPYWLDFFGSETSYLEAACRLEFILHLNSYLATENPEASRWVSQYRSDINFDYWYKSDLWRYRLDPVVPLVEKIYENLPMGPNAPFLLDLSVEHTVFQKAFQPSEQSIAGQEQEIFTKYLKALASWRSEAAYGSGRFGYETDWGPILGPRLQELK